MMRLVDIIWTFFHEEEFFLALAEVQRFQKGLV